MQLGRRLLWLCVLALICASEFVWARDAAPSPVLGAIKAELSRSLSSLSKQPVAPYFLSYEITETRSVSVAGSFGKVTASDENRRRQLNVDLRVGDYRLDNAHQIREGFPSFDFGSRFSLAEVPIEDDPDAIRGVLWYETDRQYKQAIERLTNVKTNVEVKVREEDKSGDFSHESPEKYYENP